MSDSKVQNPQYKAPRPTAWLWKLALAMILVSTSLIMIMARDLPDQNVMANIRRVVAITLVGIGLCIISATAGRWTSR